MRGGEPVLKGAECGEHLAQCRDVQLAGRGGVQVCKPNAGHPERRGDARGRAIAAYLTAVTAHADTSPEGTRDPGDGTVTSPGAYLHFSN
jgi:hypothetical protein